jgi:glycine betaine/choline ABC-type transport system substrate-binding protein
VERRFNLGGTMICHKALVNGEIDLYAEYTGTALTAILGRPAMADPQKTYRTVAKAYETRFGLKWLKPFGFNNTYAITVRADHAAREGWGRISHLKTHAQDLRAGFTSEFAERPDGYPGLSRVYGLRFKEVRDMDPSLMYHAISKGEVDVICAFATDGRIAAYRLKPLEDDRKFFPPYEAGPVIRSDVLKQHKELVAILSLLHGLLDNATMQRLNYEADGHKLSPSNIAKSFLKSKGLL